MANRRAALLAIVVILLLIPVTSFSISFAYGGSPQVVTSSISQTSNILNGTVSIPLLLPPIISQAVSLGSVNPMTQVSLGIVLPSKNLVGLEQFINQISSPVSKEYRDFLSAQQYAELYGPSSSESSSLSSFLISKGLSVSLDKSNPDLMLVSGTAATAESALKVSIESFSLGGSSFYSATSDLELPSEFSNIQTVFGLTDYGTNVAATPMYQVYGAINSSQTTTANSVYYSPSELYQIYNSSLLLKQGYSGQGVTIAIVDAYGDPYIQQELDNFSSEFNLPQTNVNVVCVDGPCNYSLGISSGWNTEIALDVEWSHAMAPNAAINLYIGSNDTFPLYDAVQMAVNDKVNSIISMSWGSPENSFGESAAVAPVFGENYPWLDQVLQQAAAEGITAFASSGDWGAYDQAQGETAPYGGAIYPSTDPYVTAVGGTSLYMNATSGYLQFPYSNATGSYGSETAWSWSDYFGGATGGGYSTIFGTPQWQTGPGISGGGRGVPDVSWDADPQTGVIVSISNGPGAGFTYYVIGGTSVGSPSWAGSMALMDQKSGGKLGLVTPILYSILNNPTEYAKAFHDVTVGNNDPTSANVGWDPLTGIGSPNLGELANYLAPSGSLGVVAQTQLSGSLAQSLSYGTAIQFSATVSSGSTPVTTGTVSASIVGPNNQQLASNIPITFNTVSGKWGGSYTIKASDPPGTWTAELSAKSGSSSGVGFTTFTVGDGVTLFAPYFNATTNSGAPVFTLVGQTLNVSAAITFPGGQCCVSSGNFNATFYLNTLTGKVEGEVPLQYNGVSQLWQGNFTIPTSADQGAWILVVSGTDSNGNSGSAYSWLNVGLNVLLGSDSPSYVLGNTITILAAPEYPNGTETPLGNFNATVTSGTKLVANVPLSFSWLEGLWTGTLTLGSNYPTGYYLITVGGNDGVGNSGSFSTVVRVSPYYLQGQVTVPSSRISISGGSEPTVSAKITYPNGAVLKTGSVEAFVSLDMNGVFTPIGHSRMTYQASTQSFVGPNFFAAASVQKTTPGEYFVSVQAFDSNGNYANLSATFFVTANSHPAISISSNSQFTPANGVISGTGTKSNPYLIAGWNTSSISISSSVTSSYELLNDWVQGSSANGIVLNTPNSPYSLIENDYAISNQGDGLVVSNSPAVAITGVDASNNAQSGIMVSNITQGTSGLLNSVAANNRVDGIELQNTPYFSISSTATTNNGRYGFYVYNSKNVTMASDNATSNSVGIYITGAQGQSYGGALISNGNFISNGVGIQINGVNQVLSSNLTNDSTVAIESTIQLQNDIGTLAGNDSVVSVESSTIGLNTYGVVVKNSLPLIVNNVISNNNDNGLNITGRYTGTGTCQVEFTNLTVFNYDSCVALNYLTDNGVSGSGMSNLNGSFVFENIALGNSADGFDFSNMTASVISGLTSVENQNNGIVFTGTTNSRITLNEVGGNLNGIVIQSSSNNTVDYNVAEFNALDGILFNSATSNSVTENLAQQNAGECMSSLSCTIAAGVEFSQSSENVIYSNTLANNTEPSGLGAGLLIDSGSASNFVFLNNATLNYAGIQISSSTSNNIAKNSLYANKYGIYLSDSPGNTILTNNFGSNDQNQYPNQPTISFTNIKNGTSIFGSISLTWTTTGQALSQENLIIDGKSQVVTGTSFVLDTTSLADGSHTITVQVTDTGGLSASSTITILTTNHQGLFVVALGPNGTPLNELTVTVTGPSGTMNSITDSDGNAVFKNLTAGTYVVSTVVNGTSISMPVNYEGNATVTLYADSLVTTASAKVSSGGTVSILFSGNILASQVSSLALSNSNGKYALTFDVASLNGTMGQETVTIPKSSIPAGLVPKVYVNGAPAQNQSYKMSGGNYLVTFSAPLGSTTSISIQFTHAMTLNVDLVVAIVVIVALLAAGLVLAFRTPRRSTF